METCPYCGSPDLVAHEMADCYACDNVECEDCGEKFFREEIPGVDHDDDCEEAS